jgi:prevent-host-death family protein
VRTALRALGRIVDADVLLIQIHTRIQCWQQCYNGSHLNRSEVISMSTVTSRDFNNDVAAAKRRAAIEPVIITDRGRPSFVLMSMSEFTRLRGPSGGIVDALRMSEDVSLETHRVDLELRVPEL